MDSTVAERNAQVRRCVKLVFIYILFVMVLSNIADALLPKFGRMICALLGTLWAVKRSGCAPEKVTLLQDTNKMTGTGFVVVLGAFMAAKLLSLLPSALLAKLLVNEENAAALQGLSKVEDTPLLSFLDLGIITAICEETVFRGCVGNTFRRYGIRFAMIMSTLLFSLYHCNILQLVSTFLPGIVLFYVAMNYSLKWSVLLHFINNGVLAICFSLLKKASPDAFFANYGEYVIELLLIIAAVCLLKKDCAAEKVRIFLSAPQNEEGVYRATMGNGWFVLVVLAMVIVSCMLLMMLSGGLPALPDMA